MSKVFTKSLFFLLFLISFAFNANAQIITIGNVSGTYGQGSTVAIPFHVNDASGCIPQNNIYSLYISDNAGNFTAAAAVDTLHGFYATFFNYTIPATALPGTYKFMVKAASTGNPTISSVASGAITVNAVTGVQAGVSSASINTTFPNIFGNCTGSAGGQFAFSNSSSISATSVTASFFNELSQTTEASNVSLLSPYTFIAKAANYTITVTATDASGTTGTTAYQLINNTVTSTISTSGNPTVCLSAGNDTLSYKIDTSANGIKNNYPGNVYTFTWGDGSPPSIYTECQIKALNTKITHNFTKASCGVTSNHNANSFEVDFQPESPYCGAIGSKSTSYAKVLSAPVNVIKGPASDAACINAQVTFENNSFPGENPNATSSSCTNTSALYTWTVDTTHTFINYKYNQSLLYTFTTTGTHTITLSLQGNSSSCPAADVTYTICVQNPPQPKFTLADTLGCAPSFITSPVNTSVIDSNCNKLNTYIWTVAGPPGFSYAGGTTSASAQPQFSFSRSGTYKVSLGITTASCGIITTKTQTIVVDTIPTAQLSPDTTLCGLRILTFGPGTVNGASQTILNGVPATDTYTWSVTGSPNFSYVNLTSANSQYPQIQFGDTTTYTVTVVHQNLCGLTATSTQHITFKNSPLVSAGGPYATICPNTAITVTGRVTGNKKSSVWLTSGNGAFSSPDSLSTTYTPSVTDVNAGHVLLTFQVTSVLPAPCNIISDTTTINIHPPDTITSAKKVSLCSGNALNYTITATTAGSTFNWVVDAAHTSANAKVTSAGTSGTVINDVLSSLDTGYAVVTYIITPQSQSCAGVPDTITVTVSPGKFTAGFTQDNSSGCGSLTVHFTNTSVPYDSQYLWNFGDGSTSTTVNPAHPFAPSPNGLDTTYIVTLQMSTSCAVVTPATSTVTIRPATPTVAIVPKSLTGCSPFTLTVNNLSPDSNKSYTWNLYESDGITLVQQIVTTNRNPVTFKPITANSTQQLVLNMIATGLCNNTDTSKNFDITVSTPTIFPQMQTANNTTSGCAPLSLTFVNLSAGGTAYYYTIYDSTGVTPFGANIVTGTGNQPYTFFTPGKYFVTISAQNSCTSYQESTPKIEIDVYPVPKAGFSADSTQGCKNMTVNFTNSTVDPSRTSTYDWNFGDGSPHFTGYTPPAHAYYAKNSPFTVTLIATNPTGCSDTVTQQNLINVYAPPSPEFSVQPDTVIDIPNYHFDFVDKSTNSPTTWLWSFGDGQTSTLENPGHTYAYGDTGVHKVTLTVYNKLSCDSTISHNVLITGIPGQLYLPNAFIPTSATVELKTFMAKGSGIKTWLLQIFNNYGELVWETNKLDSKGAPVEGWDGTFKGAPAPQGAYTWQASATFMNGTEWKGMSYNNSLPKRTGTVNLIR